jgi:hypothetical protein
MIEAKLVRVTGREPADLGADDGARTAPLGQRAGEDFLRLAVGRGRVKGVDAMLKRMEDGRDRFPRVHRTPRTAKAGETEHEAPAAQTTGGEFGRDGKVGAASGTEHGWEEKTLNSERLTLNAQGMDSNPSNRAKRKERRERINPNPRIMIDSLCSLRSLR